MCLWKRNGYSEIELNEHGLILCSGIDEWMQGFEAVIMNESAKVYVIKYELVLFRLL